MILSADLLTKSVHDIMIGKRTVERLSSADMRVSYLTADKEYDSEGFYIIVKECLGDVSLIPPRNTAERKHDNEIRRTKEKSRSGSKCMPGDLLYKNIYHKWDNSESTNLSFKRIFGENILSHKEHSKCSEALFRVIAYNLEHVDRLGFTGEFT